MILLIISFIFLIFSLILFYKSNQIKLFKNQQQENYKIKLQEQIHELEYKEKELKTAQLKKQQQINQELSQWSYNRKKEIEDYLKNQKELTNKLVKDAHESAENQIKQINQNIKDTKIHAIQQEQQIRKEIDKLKASLAAGVQARLREQEKKEKISFYKLSINETDLSDIKMLENLKVSFHKPVVLSKLIWTQYFQKQMTELCDRVLGKNVVCGIYKITNLLTEQCYIGQSVNIAERWKQHCKCGLGIQASTTNNLYNSMQKDGVWNYTFELLEECSRNDLNEKETFWINTYQSNTYGYNSTKGNLIK